MKKLILTFGVAVLALGWSFAQNDTTNDAWQNAPGNVNVDGRAVLVTSTGTPSTFILNRTDGAAVSIAAGAEAGTFRFATTEKFRIQSQPKNLIIAGAGGSQTNVVDIDGGAGANSLFIAANSNVGIGTDNPAAKLSVDGSIFATEVKVKANVEVPDYVFEEDYNLMPLSEIETYVKENKHLPEIPSAADIEEEGGVVLGEMTLNLLKKVEELTLHMIDIKKENETLKQKLEELSNSNN